MQLLVMQFSPPSVYVPPLTSHTMFHAHIESYANYILLYSNLIVILKCDNIISSFYSILNRPYYSEWVIIECYTHPQEWEYFQCSD
jgi:hypothetical protein